MAPGSGRYPLRNCNGVVITSEQAYGIVFGSNFSILSRGQPVTAISLEGKPLLLFRVTEQGLAATGDIFGKSGENARLVDNEFWLNPNSTWQCERPDRHTLIVRDNSGTETLSIRFSYQNLIIFSANFYLPNGKNLSVTDKAIIGPNGSRYSNSCSEGSVTLIHVFPSGRIGVGGLG